MSGKAGQGQTGFVDWKGLLRDVADELGLDVDTESDLVAVAQYHVNKAGGRARRDQLIMDEFTEGAEPGAAHKYLVRLPLWTVWTTNYDRLLEEAYRKLRKRADVKTTRASIAQTMPRREVVLYKMHGDVQEPAEAVLTKEDYETYLPKRQAFVTTLEADLLTKTFLFLGFSFSDPNLDYVLARIRGLLGEHQGEHFCILKQPGDNKPEGGTALALRHWARSRSRGSSPNAPSNSEIDLP